MYLKSLKTVDFNRDKKYDFFFPIGSCEQHGPFIPLGTDTYITEYVVDKVEKQMPHLIVMPMLEYSRAQEHRGFPGTVWLTEETLLSVLQDICASVASYARRIFIYSFHANDPYILKFIAAHPFPNVEIIFLDINSSEDLAYIENTLLHGPIDDHAGNSEIANMLVIKEGEVQIPEQSYPKRIIAEPFGTDNVRDKSEDGIVDNHPTWMISKEIGQKILDVYVQSVLRQMNMYM